MKRIIKCNAAFLVVVVSISVVSTFARLEEPIQVDETGEGSRCDQDQNVADVCLACSKLPFDGNTPLVSCCSDENAYFFCEACVGDQASCSKVLQEMSEVEQYDGSDVYNEEPESDYDAIYDEDDVDERIIPMSPLNKSPDIDKRFGTLFMKSPKRYGRLIYGKRGIPLPLDSGKHDMDSQEFKGRPDKRFGRLYMGSGSYFGKRDMESSQEFKESPDKRFGRLYMGSGSYFGKRSRNSSPNFEDIPDKRFGRLYMGSGSYFGKRDDGNSLESGENVDKRFGRLFVKSGSYFGKRNQEDESVFDDNVDKRFGRLYMGSGSYLGKRVFDSGSEGQLTKAEKRFGTLHMGSGGMFGKRDKDESDDANMGDLSSPVDKRYGRLSIGSNSRVWKRGSYNSFNDEDRNMDKRYGRIFMNSRQGRYRWFGKR